MAPLRIPTSAPVDSPPFERLTLLVDLPGDLLTAIATRAADLVVRGFAATPEPWIGVDKAASHLGCPRSRIYRLVSRERSGVEWNPIPYERDGARLLFKRSALDEWVARGGALT